MDGFFLLQYMHTVHTVQSSPGIELPVSLFHLSLFFPHNPLLSSRSNDMPLPQDHKEGCSPASLHVNPSCTQVSLHWHSYGRHRGRSNRAVVMQHTANEVPDRMYCWCVVQCSAVVQCYCSVKMDDICILYIMYPLILQFLYCCCTCLLYVHQPSN